MKKIIKDNAYVLQINALLEEEMYYVYQLDDTIYEVRCTNAKGVQEQMVKGNIKFCSLYLQGVRDGVQKFKQMLES